MNLFLESLSVRLYFRLNIDLMVSEPDDTAATSRCHEAFCQIVEFLLLCVGSKFSRLTLGRSFRPSLAIASCRHLSPIKKDLPIHNIDPVFNC